MFKTLPLNSVHTKKNPLFGGTKFVFHTLRYGKFVTPNCLIHLLLENWISHVVLAEKLDLPAFRILWSLSPISVKHSSSSESLAASWISSFVSLTLDSKSQVWLQLTSMVRLSFFLKTSYRIGKFSFNESDVHRLSSQNLSLVPIPTWYYTLPSKKSSQSIIPLQKPEP